jgi:hypothetical protein
LVLPSIPHCYFSILFFSTLLRLSSSLSSTTPVFLPRQPFLAHLRSRARLHL